MRILNIQAENALSFGINEDRFEIAVYESNGTDPLTILVGPNGAGKTNILRIAQWLIRFLRSPQEHSPTLDEIRSAFNRPNGLNHPITLEIDVLFDTQELRWLTRFWLLSLSLSGSWINFLSTEITPQANEVRNLSNSALNTYSEWIINQFSSDPWHAMERGSLKLHLFPKNMPSPYRQIEFTFRLTNLGWSVDLINPSRINPDPISDSTGTLGPRFPNLSLAQYVAQLLADNEKKQLAHYLAGKSPDFPALSSLVNKILPTSIPPEGITAQISQDIINSHISSSIVLGEWYQLRHFCSKGEHEDIRFGDIIRQIILDSIIIVNDWHIESQNTLEDMVLPPTDLLHQHKLAAYLFRLKNGTPEEKTLYESIHKQFLELSQLQLDIKLYVSDVKPNAVNSAQITISMPNALDPKTWVFDHKTFPTVEASIEIYANDLPLTLNGSGVSQALLWSTMIHAALSHNVLMVDEPDVYFHPTLASKITHDLLSKCDSQFLIVSHSPYMIPAGRLDFVRRIYLKNNQRLSAISEPFPMEEKQNLTLSKRGLRPDERLFLFARGVVFVEGPNDAAALEGWASRWGKKQHLSDDWLIKSGILIQSCQGKTQVAPLMRLAERFRIPNVGIWDADVLNKKTQDKKKTDDNQKVLEQWKEFNLVGSDVLSRGELTLPCRLSNRVFLIGQSVDDDLEKLFNQTWPGWTKKLAEAGYYTPLAYKVWAECHDWPNNYNDFFTKLFNTIQSLGNAP